MRSLKNDIREKIDGPPDPKHDGEPVGAVYGNVSSSSFKCILTDTSVREMDHLEVHHPVEEWVLCSVDEIELRSDLTKYDAMLHLSGSSDKVSYRRVATIKMIGRRDSDGRLRRPLTPILPSSRVYRPHPDRIKEVLGLHLSRDKGAYIGKLLNTDVEVVLDPYVLVQNHVSIIAKSGSGKSYACGVLVEELNRHEVPVVVLDLHGEYRSLISPNIEEAEYDRMSRFGVSPRGLGDSIREFGLTGPGNSDNDMTLLGIDIRKLNAEDLLDLMGVRNIGAGSSVLYTALHRVRDVLGDDMDLYDIISAVQADTNPAKWNVLNGLEHLQRIPIFSNPPTPLTQIVEKGAVTIIEMKDAPLDMQQVGAAALLKRLFSARKDGLIPPFMLIVEEAHNFCPQSGPAITSKVLRTVASEGRKFGMGLTIVSQRPAKVDKNVLSQCGTQMILKVTNPNDLKAVIASVEGLTSRMAEEVQQLPVAVSIVVGGNIMEPVLVEVRTRMTRHGGGAVDILKDLQARDGS
jgi:DNA helicase HerA-like ATPase